MKTLSKIWHWAWLLFAAVVALFFFLVIWRIVVLSGAEKTAEAVNRIHADRLQWSDINGGLPPIPDPKENEATLAGVDSNHNGIRDDVERNIYEKYKNQPKLAIAMLQYAKELQREFTSVFNSETFVAVIQEEGRGSLCVLNNNRVDEADGLTFNTEERKSYRQEIFKKYMTSYSLPSTGECDLTI